MAKTVAWHDSGWWLVGEFSPENRVAEFAPAFGRFHSRAQVFRRLSHVGITPLARAEVQTNGQLALNHADWPRD